MRRKAKSLKRNAGACKGILVAPPKLPRFSRLLKFRRRVFFTHRPKIGSRLRAPILRHGWQADKWSLGKSAGNGVSTTYKALSGAFSSVESRPETLNCPSVGPTRRAGWHPSYLNREPVQLALPWMRRAGRVRMIPKSPASIYCTHDANYNIINGSMGYQQIAVKKLPDMPCAARAILAIANRLHSQAPRHSRALRTCWSGRRDVPPGHDIDLQPWIGGRYVGYRQPQFASNDITALCNCARLV